MRFGGVTDRGMSTYHNTTHRRKSSYCAVFHSPLAQIPSSPPTAAGVREASATEGIPLGHEEETSSRILRCMPNSSRRGCRLAWFRSTSQREAKIPLGRGEEIIIGVIGWRRHGRPQRVQVGEDWKLRISRPVGEEG